MKRYKCHKVVEAAKIIATRRLDDVDEGAKAGFEIVLEGESAPVEVNYAFNGFKGPEVGGYFVKYADGYLSYSPAEPFESGYTLVAEEAE